LRFYLLAIFVFVVLSFSCIANNGHFLFEIIENGKVISYYDEYYVVQVNGTIKVTNNYNSSMYNVIIPFNIDTLNFFQISGDNFLGKDQFEFMSFNAFETKIFDYEIRGITALDPMKNNKSVLASSILVDKSSIHSLIISRIHKADIETGIANNSEIKSVKNRRLITVTLENPSAAIYNITRIDVLKTTNRTHEHSLDITNPDKKWSFLSSGEYIILGPKERWFEDIIDYEAESNDVYWLSSHTDDSFELFVKGNHTIMRFNQDDLLSPENITVIINGTEINVSDYLKHMLYVKKTYSSTHIFPGDLIEVDIRINNFAPINRNITVNDYLPLGFEYYSGNEPTINNNKLTWDLNVNPESTIKLSYFIKYIDEEMLGVDYFQPTEVIYDGGIFYTKRTSFIRKYIPEKKIFVQKKVRQGLNEEFVVEISLHNLGEDDIENILLKEFLQLNDVFREITIMPKEKGTWQIERLQKSEVFEVSYVTNKNDALMSMPEVIGVDRNSVMKTLIFQHIIKNEWKESAIKFIEKFGLFVIIFIPLTLIILNRMRRSYKERQFKKIGKQIHALKNDTTPNFFDTINFLKKEANVKTNYPENAKFSSDDYKNNIVHKESIKDKAKHNIDDLKKLHEDIEKK
jgi:hypothetical protein